MTPWWPVKPIAWQASKNPSIFSLTPPIAWIWPRWSTEPVTAKRLLDRRLGERRQQREQLGGRGAVAVDPAIGLLEHQAGVERQRPVAAEPAAEKARQDQDALRMQRAAELDLALDIDDLAAAEPHPRRDAASACRTRGCRG